MKKLIRSPEVKALLQSLRPPGPRKLLCELKVKPVSKARTLVGVAFDHLLRFEIERRAWLPATPPLEWVLPADSSCSDGTDPSCYVFQKNPEGTWSPVGSCSSPTSRHQHAMSLQRRYLERTGAQADWEEYLSTESPDVSQQAKMAAHFLRLARLEEAPHVGHIDLKELLEQPFSVEVSELLAMLAIAPFDKLVPRRLLVCNPSFGAWDLSLGDLATEFTGDPDLICDDMIVDFKTTSTGEVRAEYLGELLGYYLLTRREARWQAFCDFPVAISRVGLYFARFGYLWTLDVSVWTDNPRFAELKQLLGVP